MLIIAPLLVLALSALDLNHGGSNGPALTSGVTPYAVKPAGLPALSPATPDRVVISEFELMTNFARPSLIIHPTNDTNAASPASVTEAPMDLAPTNNKVVAEAPVGPAAINDMIPAEDPVDASPTTDVMVSEAPVDVTFTTSTVIAEDPVDTAPTTDVVVIEAPEDVTPANDTPLYPTFDCENDTTSEPLLSTHAEESKDVMRSYLLILCGICGAYLLVQIFKSFTKQTFNDALERFSAAPDSQSTLQRATRSLSFWGKNASDNDDKDADEKVDWSSGLLQITFLCSLLEMTNFSFSVVASSSEICLKIAEAIVLHLTKFLLPFDLMDMSGNLYDRVRPQMNPESVSWLRILTSPPAILRLTEAITWNMVLSVGDDMVLPCIERSVERAKETLTSAILAFMSLSRPLKKVALVLRALFMLNNILESKGVHPHHLKQLKGLMRDIHAEFPEHKDMEPIVPLLAILVQLERLLAEKNQKPVTAKVIVLATVKDGARRIVSWVDDFIFSQAYYTLDPPPTRA